MGCVSCKKTLYKFNLNHELIDGRTIQDKSEVPGLKTGNSDIVNAAFKTLKDMAAKDSFIFVTCLLNKFQSFVYHIR